MRRSKVVGIAVVVVAFSVVASEARASADKVLGRVKAALQANAKAKDSVKAFVASKLIPECKNAAFVAAVKQQNAKGM